ncbi:hypothetical protein ACJJTC_004897 [Scirpophaga incertulas]
MHNIKFTVIDIKAPPVLGLTECVKLKLIRKIDVVECVATTEKEKFIQNNKDVFTGLGVLGTYQIQVSNEAQPVVKPIRRIPVMVKDKLIKTLKKGNEVRRNEKHLIHSRNHFIVKPRQEEYRSSRQQSDLEHKIVRDYSDCNENVSSRQQFDSEHRNVRDYSDCMLYLEVGE